MSARSLATGTDAADDKTVLGIDPFATWTDGFPPPSLATDEIHVWGASLGRAGESERLAGLLSADERDRADRFRFGRDRDRFVVARGLLRLLLGHYLGRDLTVLRFRLGAQGKPAMADDPVRNHLRFNLAHAGDLALFAIAREREVGVDLERIRPDVDLAAVAASFTRGEQAALAATPVERRRSLFFAFWTHKEAYAKGVGRGLSLPFDNFEVRFENEGDAARPVVRDGDPLAHSRWTLCTLDVGSDFAAALAVVGSGWRLRCFRWPDTGATPPWPGGTVGLGRTFF